MKFPKPWRVKRGKKFIGSYWITIDGSRINLRTSDANEATKRVREAVRNGRRNFVDDADAAAAATVPAPETAAEPAPATEPPPPPASPPPAAPEPRAEDQTQAGGASSPPLPPPAGSWADAANAAAQEAASEQDTAPPPPPTVDPNVVRAILKQGAEALVMVQLALQAWIIEKRTGCVAGAPDFKNPMVKATADGAVMAWAQQLETWFPVDIMLPPWMLAVLFTSGLATIQYAQRTPKPEKKSPGGLHPIQEAEVVDNATQRAA